MSATYSGPLNDKGGQEGREPLDAQRLCSDEGDEGRELQRSFMFRSVPRTPPGTTGPPRPLGTDQPADPLPAGERRGGQAPTLPRAEAAQRRLPAVPRSPLLTPRAHGRLRLGAPSAGAAAPGPAPVPRRGSERPRFSGSTRPRGRPRSAEPALPGCRAKQSGDRERKTGRKCGSRRLPALCLDLPA